MDILTVILFPLRGERRIDLFLERLFHDRETVKRDVGAAPTFGHRLRQAGADKKQRAQRPQQSKWCQAVK